MFPSRPGKICRAVLPGYSRKSPILARWARGLVTGGCEGTAPALGLLASMAFLLSSRNECGGQPRLILTEVEAACQCSRVEAERRAAWLAARAWLNRHAAR